MAQIPSNGLALYRLGSDSKAQFQLRIDLGQGNWNDGGIGVYFGYSVAWFAQFYALMACALLFFRILQGGPVHEADFGVLAILLGLELWTRRGTFHSKLVEGLHGA